MTGDPAPEHARTRSAIRLFVLDYYRQHVAAAQTARGKPHAGDRASHRAFRAASGKAGG